MSATDQIAALVTRERHLIARREYWQSALTAIIARLGDELDEVQTERWSIQEQGFRQFDAEHARKEAA